VNPYRVPGEPAPPEDRSFEKDGFFSRLLRHVLNTGCHACRFVVGYDGLSSDYKCIVRKGRYVHVRGAGQCVESYYVCDICKSTWGKFEDP
jgi:hypothetical protein